MTFLDPLNAVAAQERNDRLPAVFPEEFYLKYKDGPDGSKIAQEWVIVAKKGQQNPQRTPMRWRDVERTPMLLQVLKPYYDNWKSGLEAPIAGTALDAWMADPELIKVLNSVHVRSVEDFVEMPDYLLTKLNMPGIRDKQNRAKAFLQAQTSTAKVSAEVAQVRDENENLKRELAELRGLIEKHAIKKEQEVAAEIPAPVMKRRGRPPKNPEAIN